MRLLKSLLLLPALSLYFACGTPDSANSSKPGLTIPQGGEAGEALGGFGGRAGDSSLGGQSSAGLGGKLGQGGYSGHCHRDLEHRAWCDPKTHECHKCSNCHQ